jgi:predicted ATP-dependent endonuclease of OLD family
MRIVELQVSNFRSVAGKETIRFRSSHAVLAGANNAGKSNLISALDWALHHYPYRLRPHPDDYYDPARAIEIEAVVGDIDADDKSGLFALCSNKQQRGALGSDDDPKISIKLTAAPIQPAPDEGAEDVDPGQVKLEISLWGFPVHRRVTDVRARLVQLLIVSPHRRVDSDLSASRWTPYGELMKSVLRDSSQFESLENLLGDVNEKITEAFGDQKARLLADARVVAYVEDVAFQLTKESDPVELLRNLEIMVTDSGRKISLDRLGTGTQSAVIIGMLELVLRAKESRMKLFAIEEPDAFIHPHGIRRLASLLKRIAAEPSAQVLLSTHSPALVTTLLPGDIVRVEKRDGRTKVFQAAGEITDRNFARYINQDTAEIFFARRAILVEGPTERFLLPPLSELVERDRKSMDFGRSGTSVIDMGGKSGVVPYLKLLREFSIEARALLDDDFLGGADCKKLVAYLQSRGDKVDDSDPKKLRSSLAKLGVVVLSKGEIEDYVPLPDVAAASGKSESEVSAVLGRTAKTSDAFKQIFDTNKPQYAQILAAHYVSEEEVPKDLDRIIGWAGS